MTTYSIQLRVRRTTYEEAYVSVPVTDAIMTRKSDGSLGIDVEAFKAEGLRLSHDSRVEWQAESTTIEPHPIQTPRPDDRKTLDGFYDLPGN